MDLALGLRVIVIGFALFLALSGVYAFSLLDIEAYPDPVQPRVELITQPVGMSAEEIEKMFTRPVEIGMEGMRSLEHIRSVSLFGLSDVKLYFSWDSDYYWDRTETLNKLSLVNLPLGQSAGINPDNPIGEIYRFYIDSPDHNLIDDKEVDDWILEKQLKTVPGVEDLETFGGLTKEYHVEVDNEALTHYQLSLPALNAALANANINVGGSYVTVGTQSFDVRGIGFIHSLDDIRNITLNTNNGANGSGSTPIRVRDLAQVSVGYSPRLGKVGIDNNDDLVEGVVLMRKYGDTLKTLDGVKKKLDEIRTEGLLPPGTKVIPYYDRTELVHTTLHTVFENLSLGMILVFLVLLFFLGNLRTAIIAAINIPLAMAGAFVLLYLTHTPANLLSLGAVDFGIIIDSIIIVVENIFRHLTTDRLESEDELHCIRRASMEVGGPMLYSTLIFLVAFIPLFTMKGVEGVIFSPMSHTYAFALVTAILLAVTLTPALSSFLLKKGMKETHNIIWLSFHRFYHNLFVRCLRFPRATCAVIVMILAGGLCLFPYLGGEFLPKLERETSGRAPPSPKHGRCNIAPK